MLFGDQHSVQGVDDIIRGLANGGIPAGFFVDQLDEVPKVYIGRGHLAAKDAGE